MTSAPSATEPCPVTPPSVETLPASPSPHMTPGATGAGQMQGPPANPVKADIMSEDDMTADNMYAAEREAILCWEMGLTDAAVDCLALYNRLWARGLR